MRDLTKRTAKAAIRALPFGRRVLAHVEGLAGANAALRRELRLHTERERSLQARCLELASACGELELQTARDRALLDRYGEPPWVPNGHFYSPIHSRHETERDIERIYPPVPRELADIDLREAEQLALLEQLLPHLSAFDAGPEPAGGRRYGYANGAYTFGDAVFLDAMLRHVRPARLVEVGSGHSSCVTLDANERWFDGAIDCTFIDPYPQLLRSLLKPGDSDRVRIIADRVQDVELGVFAALEDNDVLFIDSTHVTKIGSDVNRLYFDVLPLLAEGVYIHIHDVMYPFEYPRSWVLGDGRAWNEQYVLRALLQNSDAYEIVLFNTFLTQFHEDYFARRLPAALSDRGGSIWLRKRRKSGSRAP